MFRVQQAATTTLYIGLYALGLDACMFRGKLTWNKTYCWLFLSAMPLECYWYCDRSSRHTFLVNCLPEILSRFRRTYLPLLLEAYCCWYIIDHKELKLISTIISSFTSCCGHFEVETENSQVFHSFYYLGRQCWTCLMAVQSLTSSGSVCLSVCDTLTGKQMDRWDWLDFQFHIMISSIMHLKKLLCSTLLLTQVEDY